MLKIFYCHSTWIICWHATRDTSCQRIVLPGLYGHEVFLCHCAAEEMSVDILCKSIAHATVAHLQPDYPLRAAQNREKAGLMLQTGAAHFHVALGKLYDEFISPAVDDYDFYRSERERHLSAPFSAVSAVIHHLQESIKRIYLFQQLTFTVDDKTLDDLTVQRVKNSLDCVHLALVYAIVESVSAPIKDYRHFLHRFSEIVEKLSSCTCLSFSGRLAV